MEEPFLESVEALKRWLSAPYFALRSLGILGAESLDDGKLWLFVK